MAKYKACSVHFNKCTQNDLAHSTTVDSTGVSIGKLMDVDIKPNRAESVLYADDDVAEKVSLFKDADVTVNVDELPYAAYTALFNEAAKQTTDTNAANRKSMYISDSSTNPNYGTLSYIYANMKNGVTTYTVVCYHRVMFDVPEEKNTTKGENITFEGTGLTGKAYPDQNGQWRTRVPGFTTLAAAEAFRVLLACRNSNTVNTDSVDSLELIDEDDPGDTGTTGTDSNSGETEITGTDSNSGETIDPETDPGETTTP